MWDLPRPGIEAVSIALQGGYFTTEPSGKQILRAWNPDRGYVVPFIFNWLEGWGWNPPKVQSAALREANGAGSGPIIPDDRGVCPNLPPDLRATLV